MKVKIKNCKDCPAHYWSERTYSICNFLEKGKRALGWMDLSLDTPPPSTCPLRQGKIEVELEE